MNIDLFRKKTGLKYKEAAKALGVNPVTITRWKQKWGGEIPKDYKEKIDKALKAKKGNHVPKAPPKVKQARVPSSKIKGSEKEWNELICNEAILLQIVNLYGDLPHDEKFSEIRMAIKKFLTKKE